MGRKSREKRERRSGGFDERQHPRGAAGRFAEKPRPAAGPASAAELRAAARRTTDLLTGWADVAAAAAAAADPGPHPLLPERLHDARRRRLAAHAGNEAMLSGVYAVIVARRTGSPTPRTPPDYPYPAEAVHEADAGVARDDLLAAADADPAAEPDPALCTVIADCLRVDRPGVDPLPSGTYLLGLELMHRLDRIPPYGDDEGEALAAASDAVAAACGDRARRLVEWVAAAVERPSPWPQYDDHYDDDDATPDPIRGWADEASVALPEAVAVAVKAAAVLGRLDPG